MKFVEPIKDLKKIAQIKYTLRGKGAIRDLLLFELGINSALRISDLLKVRSGDLFDGEGLPKASFEVKETKTDKTSNITVTPKVKVTLEEYRRRYPTVVEQKDAYVFFHSKRSPIGSMAIGRKQAWVMIAKWCREAGLNGRFGGHTLRKTWGYQARLKSVTLEIIQHRLNHSSLAITQRYLGISDEEVAEACNRLDL